MKPLLISSEKKESLHKDSILIIDKLGTLGPLLAAILQKDFTVVLVSNQPFPSSSIKAGIHVAIDRKAPLIPNFTYSFQFVIYNGERQIREFIPQLLKKAKKDNGKVVFVISREHCTPDVLNQLLMSPFGLVVVVGDIFKKSGVVDKRSLINTYLYQALSTGKIKVPNQGTESTYPVVGDDVLAGLITIAFGTARGVKLFYLFPHYPPTELSLAHMMQKIDPDLLIDFSKIPIKRKRIDIPHGGEYLLSDRYNLLDKLKSLGVLQKKKVAQQATIHKVDETPAEKKSFSLWTPFFVVIIFSLALLVIPIGVMAASTGIGISLVKSARTAFESGHITAAKRAASGSKAFFGLAAHVSEAVMIEASAIGKRDEIVAVRNSLTMAKEGADAFVSLLQAAQAGSTLWQGKSKDPKADFTTITQSVKQALALIQKAESDYAAVKDKNSMVLMYSSSGKEYASLLGTLQKMDTLMSLTEDALDVAPRILGFEGKKTYLLVFQNNMELRPGGGLIESYALVSFENGSISEFKIHDVSDADGQLKGHIEPPYPIRRYVPSTHWFMRDSNFDIDYLKNASKTAYFLNLELGQAVDGIISVDSTMIKNLLGVVGPVYLPDFQEEVTTENMQSLIQAHTEKNPGSASAQKKDFVRSLIVVIEQKLLEGKNFSYLKLAEALNKSLVEKHMLFAFAQPSIQTIFTVNRVSSTLWDDRSSTANSAQDFFGLSEANVGSNKANAFVKRKIDHHVFLDTSGKLSSQVSVNYKNTSTGWPGGAYKTYVRFVLPTGSVLTDVTIDGREQQLTAAVTDPQLYEKTNFKPPKELEVEKIEEQDKTVYGFLVVVPANSSSTVTISYSLMQKLPSQPTAAYALRVFKQPGTEDDAYTFTLNYPQDYTVLKSSEPVKNAGESISWSTDLSTDKDLQITLVKR